MAPRDNVHRVIQPHFSSGEVSPEVSARVDNPRHQSTLRTCTNGYTSERGAVTKRVGTHYGWTVLDSARKYRLATHVATTRVIHYLEMSDVGIRVLDSDHVHVDDVRTWTVSTQVESGLSSPAEWAPDFTYTRTDPPPGIGHLIHVIPFAHGELVGVTGDGAARFEAIGGGTLPTALLASTDYWINVKRADPLLAPSPPFIKPIYVVSIHSSEADALSDTNRVDLSGGTGSFTMEFWVAGSVGATRRKLTLPILYAEDDLEDIRITTNEDTLFLFRENQKPWQILRDGGSDYRVFDPDMIFGPWDDFQEIPGTMAVEGLTGLGDAVPFGSRRGFGFDWAIGSAFTPGGVMGLFTDADIGRMLLIPSDVGPAGKAGYVIGRIESVEGVANGLSADYINQLGLNDKWTGGLLIIEGEFTGDPAGAATELEGLNWKFGHFYSDVLGWPRIGAFREDRQIMSGGGLSANTVNGSRVARFTDFAPFDEALNEAGGAVKFTPISDKNQYDEINFMATFRDFLLGSAAGLWKVATAFSAVDKTNARGSAFIESVQSEDFAFFAGAGADRLHGVRFSDETQGYDLIDFSSFAEHIVDVGIREMVFAEEPDPVIYLRLSDGTLGVFRFNPAYELQAWSHYITSGVIESLAVAPSVGNTHSRLYMVVQRAIELAGVPSFLRHIEYLTEEWDEGVVETEAFFVDSGVTVVAENSSPVIEPGGAIEGVRLVAVDLGDGDMLALELDAAYLGVDEQKDVFIEEIEGPVGRLINSRSWKVHRPVGQPDTLAFLQTRDGAYIPIVTTDRHAAITQMKLYELGTTFGVPLQNLVGREVKAMADGEIIGPFTVADTDGVEFEGPIGLLHVGLTYDYVAEPQPPEMTLPASTTYGAKRSINNVMLSLSRSQGGKVRLLGDDSEEPGEYEDIVTRRVSDVHGVTSQFFTGNVDVQPQGGSMNDQRVEIFHDEPAPITVRAIVYEVDFQLKGRTS